jgi:hypothetical protein
MKQLFLTLTFIFFVIPFGISQDIILNGSVSIENNQIKNVGEPTENKDVTTKNYVDELIENQQINNGKVYAFRVDYLVTDLSNTNGDITQLTDGNYSNGSVTINHTSVSAVTFQFNDELFPPTSVIVYAYAYDGQISAYNVGNVSYSSDSNVKVSTSVNSPNVENGITTDLINNFSSVKMKLNLTAGDIGVNSGSDASFNHYNGHAYLFFRF